MEKLFTMMAYTPKATVQAAIGGIPLTLSDRNESLLMSVQKPARYMGGEFNSILIAVTKNFWQKLSDSIAMYSQYKIK